MASTRLLLSAAVSATGDAGGSASLDPAVLRSLARAADREGLDLLILEPPADALVTASWLISVTRRLGLVAAIPATYAQPFHVARALSAMDLLSSGRIGWLPMTSGHVATAEAFGNLPYLPMPSALAKAVEFVAATQALWDSWDEDALIIDKASARYLDSGKIRRVDFRGDYFQVMGPLNAARPLQGYPALVQLDGDPLSDALQKSADLLIVSAASWDEAKRRTAALKKAGAGCILIRTVCALGLSMTTNQRQALAPLRAEGSASDIVDTLEEVHYSVGCDGFDLVSATGPVGLQSLLEQVLPEWRRRAPLDAEAGGETLRARLGTPAPLNPYSGR